MARYFLQILLLESIFLNLFCSEFDKLFKINVYEENSKYSMGFLNVRFKRFNNLSIILNRKLYKWFSNEKGKVCQSMNFDEKFSSIRLHIAEKKSKAVFFQETNPCCQMFYSFFS